MSEFKRTYSCETCGEVIFELKQGCGYVKYYCKKCEKCVGRAIFQPYETLNTKCGNCKNDTFKVLIQVNDNEQRYYETICSKCKESATKEYKDIDGNYIDDITRERLIKDDTIIELQRALDEEKEKSESNEDEIQDLRYELQDKEKYIYNLENKVRQKDDEISDLEYTVEDLEYDNRSLESKIRSLES